MRNKQVLGSSSDYPAGFNGLEGEREDTFIFYVNGEVDIEHYTEEEAEQELMGMTLGELIQHGLVIE